MNKKVKSILIFVLVFILVFPISNAFQRKNEDNVEVASGVSSNIPVVVTINDPYLPLAWVTISSLLENANDGTNYDIYFFVSEQFTRTEEVVAIEAEFDNCRTYIVRISDDFCIDWATDRFVKESYYRLLIPMVDALKDYERVIYIDVDIIVLHDLGELYHRNITEDWLVAGVADNIRVFKDTYVEVYHYEKEIPGIDDFSKYINSGVLLFNMKECIKFNLVSKFIEYMAIYKGQAHDQAAINKCCFPLIHTLPFKDNMQVISGSSLPYEENGLAQQLYTKDVYEEGRSDPIIIHYAASKPWKESNVPWGEVWWKWAKQTPYFGDDTAISRNYANEVTDKSKQITEGEVLREPELEGDLETRELLEGKPPEYSIDFSSVSKSFEKNKDMIIFSDKGRRAFSESVKIRISEPEEYKKLYTLLLPEDCRKSFMFFDMTALNDDGEKVEIKEDEEVEVQLPVPDQFLEKSKGLQIFTFIDGKAIEIMNKLNKPEGSSVPCLYFTISHFSPYAIAYPEVKSSNVWIWVGVGSLFLIAAIYFMYRLNSSKKTPY
ncbi:MAG: glycosyltransferase family 8 protein [Oscillospiraceae bacterium]|jgi:lipopolysaccharide biosynthesis glycosyltransferase|nr:glycosyltransferase family 8 protein [Oscillospiraceae bacterium]